MRPANNCIIKIPSVLYGRLKALSAKQGYSSAEELINHILEKTVDGGLSGIALAKTEATSTAEDAKTETVKRQLKGLGYFNG